MDHAAPPSFATVPTEVDVRLIPAVFALALHSASITVGGSAGFLLLVMDFFCLPCTTFFVQRCFKLDKMHSWLVALAALSGLVLLSEWFVTEYAEQFGSETGQTLPPIEA